MVLGIRHKVVHCRLATNGRDDLALGPGVNFPELKVPLRVALYFSVLSKVTVWFVVELSFEEGKSKPTRTAECQLLSNLMATFRSSLLVTEVRQLRQSYRQWHPLREWNKPEDRPSMTER